jgi:hypothetical protein
MKDFNIYTRRSKEPIAVKIGWSWPAFFFNLVWMLSKRLWLLFLVISALMILVQTVVTDNMGGGVESYLFVVIIGFVICLVLARNGNELHQGKLVKRGYKSTAKVIAKNRTLAAIQFKESNRENGGENNPKSKSQNDSKVTNAYNSSADQERILNLIKRYPGLKARQIATELSLNKSDVNIILYGPLQNQVQHDSEYKWSITSKKKEEKITKKNKNPVIKNAQEKVKSNKPKEDLNEDIPTDFIKEIRELKLLLDDGAINKFEFEQLKKKIIDKI